MPNETNIPNSAQPITVWAAGSRSSVLDTELYTSRELAYAAVMHALYEDDFWMSKLTTDQQDIMSHLREVPETALNCYNLFCQPNNRWDVDEMQVRNCLREDACPEAAAKVMAAMKSSEA